MAITGRSKNRKRAGKRHVTTLAAATTIASLYMLAPTVAHAQKWSIDAGIGSQLTWSNNAELGIAGGREDTILNVRPHVSMLVEGAKLRVSGTAALNGIVSANGTQPNRVLPEADIGARLEAIDRFLFLDAGARALQTSQDAFGARPEAGTNANTVTTGQLRFSPSIESSIDSDTRYQLRSDNSWTRESGGGATATPSLAEGYFARHTALVEHDPRPLGWRLEAERQQTRYRDETQPTLTIDLFRVRADYAINTDFTAGVRVGRERTTLLLDDDAWHTLYGVEARWQPSSTTSLSAFREKRFYGPSWRLAFDHHTPLIAWNLATSRSVETAPQSLFGLSTINNVTALLDASLISRFPDPLERARVVQNIMARGVSPQTLQPFGLFDQRVSTVTNYSIGVLLTGVRNTLALGAFRLRTEDVVQAAPVFATGTAAANNVQYGASAELTHRLSPTLTANIGADWSRITAIQAPDQSIQRTVRARVSLQATPRTVAFFGARYRDLQSNVATEGDETAVFVGIDHIF